jgi:hypothetical protein
MKKRKIWAALREIVPYAAGTLYLLGIFAGVSGGVCLAAANQWSGEVGGALGFALGGIAAAIPPAIVFGRKWWRDLEPAERPEILRRQAARHDEKSGAISEAPSAGGELSGVER